MPAGQPTKYRKKYCEELIDHMSQGYSFGSFAGKILVNRDTLFEWANKHKEFSDAKEIGLAANLYKLEGIGLMATLGKLKINQRAWEMFMKNIHQWKEKVDITSDNDPIETVHYYLPDNGLRIKED